VKNPRSVRLVIRGIDSLSGWSGKVVSLLIFPVIVVIIYEVVMRYVFDAPTLWAHESSQLMYGFYGIMGGAYCLQQKSHVNVELLYARFSLRGRAFLDILTSPLFFMFCVVFILEGLGIGLRSLNMLEHSSSAWAPPVWPCKLAIPLGALLLMLQGLAKSVRDFYIVITGKELTITDGGPDEH